MRRRFGMCLALLPIVLLIGCRTVPEPMDVLDRYLAAHNAQEVEAELALFGEGAVYELAGPALFQGPRELRDLVEWDAVMLSRLSASDIRQEGDSLVIDGLAEANQWYQFLGVELAVHLPGTLVRVEEGVIVEVRRAPLAEETLLAVEEAVEQFLDWARATQGDELGELMEGDRFVYSAEAAQRWMRLLRAWHETEDPIDPVDPSPRATTP